MSRREYESDPDRPDSVRRHPFLRYTLGRSHAWQCHAVPGCHRRDTFLPGSTSVHFPVFAKGTSYHQVFSAPKLVHLHPELIPTSSATYLHRESKWDGPE